MASQTRPDLQVEVSMSQQARHAYDNMLCTRLPLAWISSTGTFSTMLSPMAPAFLSQGLGLDVQKLAAYLLLTSAGRDELGVFSVPRCLRSGGLT